MSGKLVVVATPLGNLNDLSARALDTLRGADWIACEDTRHTGRLLARHGIDRPLVSHHRFNERARLAPILRRLATGETVALVSDGGTPGISDPGYRLVAAALDAGVTVSPIPGPSAVVTLLSVSGLPADRFVFDGFLPHRAGERRRRLRELAVETRTIVVLETPHRIRDALRDLAEVLGSRPIVLGRELTKLHETLLRGGASELLERLGANPRGEITLAIAGADATAASETRAAALREAWRLALAEFPDDRRAALRHVARALGLKRAELFRRLTELGEAVD